MSKRLLHISSDLSLPQAAVTATIVVYGGKGQGKTNFGGVLAEEFSAAGLRFSVLDPMGVWYGLRHAANGKDPGVECLILGGAHGDIPIEPTGGAVIADLVADNDVSVIIDISRRANGEMWSLGERIRFTADYGKQLFRRQGSLIDGKRREPLCQIIDEAARFVPQMIGAGEPDVARCAGVWRAIVEEGRNIGLGVMLLTQRSARLNKDVAELADLMLAFRTVGPNSIQAVIDWLGAHIPKAQLNPMIEQIRSLPVGSALAVSPGWLQVEKVIRIRMRDTFDSSATPKPGEAAVRVRGAGAKPDLALYASRMRETIERAAADDPRVLRKRIADLEAAALKASKNPVTIGSKPTLAITKPVKSERELMLEHQLRAASKTAGAYEKAMTNILQLSATLAATANRIQEAVQTARGEAVEAAASVPAATVPAKAAPRQAAAPAPRVVPSRPPAEGDSALSGPERRILSALAWFAAIGIEQPEGNAVAFIAGFASADSSGYRNPRSKLNVAGLVELIHPGMIRLTDAGAAVAEAPEIERSNAGIQEAVLAKLTGPERRLLEPLIRVYPDTMTAADLAKEAEYSSPDSSGFRNPRARLNTLGLIRAGGGILQAAEILFPIGA